MSNKQPKRRLTDIKVKGGVLRPVGNNIYSAIGRSHAENGMWIPKSPYSDIEFEGGEAIAEQPDSIIIGSKEKLINEHADGSLTPAVKPFGGNISPAKAMKKGYNPEYVNDVQQAYKDRFNLNDDGTKKGKSNHAELGKKQELQEVPQHLKEVVVTPAPWQIDFKKNFGDKYIRKGIIKGINQAIQNDIDNYEYLKSQNLNIERDDYNILNRLYNTWNIAGRPKIKQDNFLINKIGSIIGQDDRPNYNPISKTIHIPIKGMKNHDYGKTDDINYEILDSTIAELAHPIQDKKGKNKGFLKYITNIPKTIAGEITGDRRHYEDENHYEYETHNIIQPEIEEYIYNNKATKYVNKKRYGGKKKAALGEKEDIPTTRDLIISLAKAGIDYTVDKIKTPLAIARNVSDTFLRTNNIVNPKQTNSHVSRKYNAVGARLARMQADINKSKLPKQVGDIVPFGINYQALRRFNNGKYATFDNNNLLDALNDGLSAWEYNNGQTSGAIQIDPDNNDNYIVKLTDAYTFDDSYANDAQAAERSKLRKIMGQVGRPDGDKNATHQEYYYSIPRTENDTVQSHAVYPEDYVNGNLSDTEIARIKSLFQNANKKAMGGKLTIVPFTGQLANTKTTVARMGTKKALIGTKQNLTADNIIRGNDGTIYYRDEHGFVYPITNTDYVDGKLSRIDSKKVIKDSTPVNLNTNNIFSNIEFPVADLTKNGDVTWLNRRPGYNYTRTSRDMSPVDKANIAVVTDNSPITFTPKQTKDRAKRTKAEVASRNRARRGPSINEMISLGNAVTSGLLTNKPDKIDKYYTTDELPEVVVSTPANKTTPTPVSVPTTTTEQVEDNQEYTPTKVLNHDYISTNGLIDYSRFIRPFSGNTPTAPATKVSTPANKTKSTPAVTPISITTIPAKPTSNNPNIIVTDDGQEVIVKQNVKPSKPKITRTRVSADDEPIVDNNDNTTKSNILKDSWNYIKNNSGDIIPTGINILGSVGSWLTNNIAINRMREPKAPIPKLAAKLKTRININPQLDKMREITAAYSRNVRQNTTSSAVALNRLNRANFANTQQVNQLYGQKENMETELINKDKLNWQSVANSNVDSYNQYLDKVTEFNNRKQELKSENATALFQGINNAIQSGLTRRDKRRQYELTKAYLDKVYPVAARYMNS
ncbi:MAG: hypothetical protein KNU04_gp41 [crAssphage sp. isolate ctbg_1]|uniref:Uncharacterized protein n=1 Tax=crAssphage sp. isolate ctbg_1 TaxID=2989854 RepID=A0A345MT05_9CAUD|nr:MAG: hypothetical protein KNU04_gp41 [crAssphage sp. isolate ctbg_1]AXH74505.1 MAG: hypothetical protein [crAssphage sp. isolate ctbg_1]